MASRFGGIDGSHHKTWVIDQMARALCGGSVTRSLDNGFKEIGENEEYRAWVKDACDGEDGPETYTWDTGIAP
jgi:hypothetical protein